MQVTYKILFSVDIRNDYYKDGLCADFGIVPSAETVLLFKKYQLLSKMVGSKLVVLAKINDDGTPASTIDTSAKFCFYMDLQNAVFVNFTNISLEALAVKRFYFSNLSKNDTDGNFNLSAVIEEYDDETAYTPGQFADDGAGNIFECVQNTTGNDTDSEFWLARGQNQYASLTDMRHRKTMIFDYSLPLPAPPADNFRINVFAINTATNTYNKVAKTETQKFSTATRDIRVDMSGAGSGSYRVEINKNITDVYADDAFVYGGYFGVIEIFSHLPGTDGFSFLDNDGKVIEKTYTIHFANRMAFWKYITPRQGIISITDKNNLYSFDPETGPAAGFISTTLIPVSQAPKTFMLDLVKNINSKETPVAPGPDLLMPGVITKKDENFCYNIYLNY